MIEAFSRLIHRDYEAIVQVSIFTCPVYAVHACGGLAALFVTCCSSDATSSIAVTSACTLHVCLPPLLVSPWQPQAVLKAVGVLLWLSRVISCSRCCHLQGCVTMVFASVASTDLTTTGCACWDDLQSPVMLRSALLLSAGLCDAAVHPPGH
jgi:hypothetical protein